MNRLRRRLKDRGDLIRVLVIAERKGKPYQTHRWKKRNEPDSEWGKPALEREGFIHRMASCVKAVEPVYYYGVDSSSWLSFLESVRRYQEAVRLARSLYGDDETKTMIAKALTRHFGPTGRQFAGPSVLAIMSEPFSLEMALDMVEQNSSNLQERIDGILDIIRTLVWRVSGLYGLLDIPSREQDYFQYVNSHLNRPIQRRALDAAHEILLRLESDPALCETPFEDASARTYLDGILEAIRLTRGTQRAVLAPDLKDWYGRDYALEIAEMLARLESVTKRQNVEFVDRTDTKEVVSYLESVLRPEDFLVLYRLEQRYGGTILFSLLRWLSKHYNEPEMEQEYPEVHQAYLEWWRARSSS